MTPELIEAIGTYIVFPVCFFGFMAWLVWSSRDMGGGE
jgi:hypothetical protein